MDVEIQNMRNRLDTEKKETGAPFYSWKRFRFTTSSGLIVIAFLVFIWLLYTTIRKDGSPEEEGIVEATPTLSGEEGELSPGSLREEEFPSAAEPEETAEAAAPAPREEAAGEAAEEASSEEEPVREERPESGAA